MSRQSSSSGGVLPRASGSQTLNDMAQQPSPLPGNSGSRTDTLTFIPTLAEVNKSEKKTKKEKDDSENAGPRKTSGGWGWFKGSDDKDKKEKRRDEDYKDAKKGKTRTVLDKAHDSARLDVLHTTIDTAVAKGRESLLLDRDSIDNKLLDERKKESSRRSGPEIKKEKDGLFSTLFGGSKKKGERESSSSKKASSLRAVSPEPPHRQLKPDIDYNWTRFSILEERAIYRMAHIKLANPRRALYSQVLLSNFMYSYLAKVQQMHPHVQVPQSAQQKKQQEAERRQKEQEQQYLEQQQNQQQDDSHYQYDYHQGIAQYAEQQQPQQPEGVTYVDDSQIYDHDHQGEDLSGRQASNRPQSRASQHSNESGRGGQSQYGRQDHNYYPYGQNDQSSHAQHDDDEMW